MPKFGQMAAGSRFFSTEGGCNGVQPFQGWHGGLGIELPGLGQVCFLSKIRDLKQGGPTFYSTSNEIRCLVFQEIVSSEVVVNGTKG